MIDVTLLVISWLSVWYCVQRFGETAVFDLYCILYRYVPIFSLELSIFLRGIRYKVHELPWCRRSHLKTHWEKLAPCHHRTQIAVVSTTNDYCIAPRTVFQLRTRNIENIDFTYTIAVLECCKKNCYPRPTFRPYGDRKEWLDIQRYPHQCSGLAAKSQIQTTLVTQNRYFTILAIRASAFTNIKSNILRRATSGSMVTWATSHQGRGRCT
jgi:hypothetical protein